MRELADDHHPARYLATGDTRGLGKRVEMTAVRADGSEFPMELAITRITTEGSTILHRLPARHHGPQPCSRKLQVTQELLYLAQRSAGRYGGRLVCAEGDQLLVA